MFIPCEYTVRWQEVRLETYCQLASGREASLTNVATRAGPGAPLGPRGLLPLLPGPSCVIPDAGLCYSHAYLGQFYLLGPLCNLITLNK